MRFGAVSVLVASVSLRACDALALRAFAETRASVVPFAHPSAEWREFESLRGSGLEESVLDDFFRRRPGLVMDRLVTVAATITDARRDWERSGTNDDDDDDVAAGWDVPDARRPSETKITDRGRRLVERASSLGPLSVKICQTLSQRPDIVGHEAATAFKSLQTSNRKYDDDQAWAVLRESLGHDGPIAPNVGTMGDHSDNARTLFRDITSTPVAVASLGQVYKATTHDGLEVAVKIQRPDGVATVSKDTQCFRIALRLFRLYLNLTGKVFSNGRVDDVVDRVARDVFDELDYEKEARNGVRFERSLDFLGFVRAPIVVQRHSTDRVLVTEWVRGHHLSALSRENGRRMVRMAVEACTASLVLTGYVHADPHEGNLMLDEDGRLVFLDFGLMSCVDQEVMEAFARGIRACLAEDWTSLTEAFQATGFITNPTRFRRTKAEDFREYGVDPVTGADLGLPALSEDIGEAMRRVPGGTSRFGALATVLNKEISPRWQLFTPPYVLLLIRTFLTLEGIAGRVDPDFNIYRAASPWAVRRSLSPLTEEGRRDLRDALLTEDGRVRWEELSGRRSAAATTPRRSSEDDREDGRGLRDALGAVLASTEGAELRRIARDLDSADLLNHRLLGRGARGLRRAAAKTVGEALLDRITTDDDGDEEVRTPSSEVRSASKRRRRRSSRRVVMFLIKNHLMRQLKGGPRGVRALLSLTWLTSRIAAGALRHAAVGALSRSRTRRRERRRTRRDATTTIETEHT